MDYMKKATTPVPHLGAAKGNRCSHGDYPVPSNPAAAAAEEIPLSVAVLF